MRAVFGPPVFIRPLAYNPAQQRFWRFRYDAPAHVLLFETSPDADGLRFWTNNIESCGANTQCRGVKRIDTSAAFSLSIEFQETGYVVERFYEASFGRPPKFAEYLPDLSAMRDGVVIGQP